VPAGAVRVDGRGKYLIPGLADMHTHFAEVPLEALLVRWLAYGVTTIRNLDHNGSSGRASTSGPWRGYGRLADSATRGRRGDVAPAEVAERIEAYKAAGYDFVKPYFENREVFDSIVAAARRVGLPVAGHVPSAVPLPVRWRA
jgi:hypothetical protein